MTERRVETAHKQQKVKPPVSHTQKNATKDWILFCKIPLPTALFFFLFLAAGPAGQFLTFPHDSSVADTF